jgi:hypothetical protein
MDRTRRRCNVCAHCCRLGRRSSRIMYRSKRRRAVRGRQNGSTNHGQLLWLRECLHVKHARRDLLLRVVCREWSKRRCSGRVPRWEPHPEWMHRQTTLSRVRVRIWGKQDLFRRHISIPWSIHSFGMVRLVEVGLLRESCGVVGAQQGGCQVAFRELVVHRTKVISRHPLVSIRSGGSTLAASCLALIGTVHAVL